MSNSIKSWICAALVRAFKTCCQAAVAAIPTTASVIGDVSWTLVAGVAALAGVMSILTSIAGIPEVDNGDGLAAIIAQARSNE